MPSFSPPPQKWSCSRRWKLRCLAVLLFAIALFAHPLAQVAAQERPVIVTNTATASYQTSQNTLIETISEEISASVGRPLIDPAGNILGCDGQPLDSYVGFSMALFETDASGLDLGGLVTLTPNMAGDNAPPVPPNTDNINPFPLADNGRYNFLLDEDQGQTDAGTTYILVIRPPNDSPFEERRVKLEMLGVDRTNSALPPQLSYRATSLDGQPISLEGETEIERQIEVVEIEDAAQTRITIFFELGIDSILCEAEQVNITKTADRSAAQPGDVVVYRLNIKNLAPVDVEQVTATDTLPVGFELLPDSVSGQIDGASVAVNSTVLGDTVRFRAEGVLNPEQVIDIVYAARLTPDALRGTGRNSVLLTALRTDSGFRLQDGPSEHRVTLDPGILSDCGTLIGRVFEDKNFDGEQQPGEAGIPNAVIFLDDGNRIVTDADGLFSVQKMLPGQRTGTLDISSLPGYTLAANLRFNERNSTSRLVNLAPGGLVRMNFAVTPTFQEAQQ